MHYIHLVIDIIIIAGIVWGVSRKRNTLLGILLGLAYLTLSVYFGYRHQENSDLFFWHPYIAWSVANVFMAGVDCGRRAINGKVLLWERIALYECVVIPVLAGFTLTVGWLMKLYIR